MATARDAHLRPIEPRDHTDVLDLNGRYEHDLAPLGEGRLLQLLDLTDRADVIDLGGRFAGFVFTFGPGSAYDSPNYRWFAERYGRDFYYLDRIAISDEFQRRGLGGFVYDELEGIAAPYGRLTLEVHTIPPNEPSLAFHRHRGYAELELVGDETDAVTMMARELR